MSSRIFGFTDNAPLLDITSIAFTGIVAYLVFSDHILSRLNEAARDSCYSDMIQHLYKDLTITGVLSFALAILLGTDSFRASEHVIYLEIAEVTLFFATLYHVLFSAILIASNRSYLNYLNKKLEVDPVDLTNLYNSLTAFEQSPWCFWKGRIRRELELRVFRIVFHSYYKLTRTFDFAKYLALCKEVNIVHLLKVNPAHWSSMLILLGLNYLRSTHIHFFQYELSFIKTHFCEEKSGDVRVCTNITSQVFLFALITGFHTVAAVGLAYASRVCVVNILTAAGPKHPSEYSDYVLLDERSDLEKTDCLERMSWKELKNHISVLKNSTPPDDKDDTILEIIPRKLSDGTKKLWNSTRNLMKNISFTSKVSALDSNSFGPTTGGKQGQTTQNKYEQQVSMFDDDSSADGMESSSRNDAICYNKRGSILGAPSEKQESVNDRLVNDLETGDPSNKAKAKQISNSEKKSSSKKSSKLFDGLSHAERKLDVFLFGSPKIYYFIRGTSNWSFCVLLAFYTTSFGHLSIRTRNPLMWTAITVGLFLIMGWCQHYTIHASSFIYAFSKLDKDVIGRVIEENEEKMELERKLRKKLVSKLQNAVGEKFKETKVAVLLLFGEIKSLSDNCDGYISKKELRLLLQKLDIHFSERRFNETFRLFDANVDGSIGLSELYNFIYPEKANKEKREARKKRYRAIVGISIKNISSKTTERARQLPVFKPQGGRRASLVIRDTAGVSHSKGSDSDQIHDTNLIPSGLLLPVPKISYRSSSSLSGKTDSSRSLRIDDSDKKSESNDALCLIRENSRNRTDDGTTTTHEFDPLSNPASIKRPDIKVDIDMTISHKASEAGDSTAIARTRTTSSHGDETATDHVNSSGSRMLPMQHRRRFPSGDSAESDTQRAYSPSLIPSSNTLFSSRETAYSLGVRTTASIELGIDGAQVDRHVSSDHERESPNVIKEDIFEL